jgi:hypothetical protein
MESLGDGDAMKSRPVLTKKQNTTAEPDSKPSRAFYFRPSKPHNLSPESAMS